ncbi:Methyltransferase domain-containing protein [Sinosporangium album]|uniref:Methyltransferase domain-containing protein n=1 Tax=Sinosporangium album TaxID=504805 RepID=A0A1G7QWF2_9ACTN|nr:class I SAM-dependent methyltransferase [Sinosporangium album]SDG02219.1 Methyltransferase domain-containing protein [Sinosporangium album]
MTESPAADGWELSDTDVFIKYGDAFVPRRREQVATVCDLLRDLPVAHVLDLCCGEGRLAEEYLSRVPGARVTLLDGSEEMLEAAGRRLAPYAERISRVQADLEGSAWRKGTLYGGVMTSLAVHHLDGDGKRALYRDIHAMLEPGGVFVMADLVETPGRRARTLAGDQWEAAVRHASETLYGGPDAWAAFERTEWNHFRLPWPDPVDKPSTVAQHVDWLREAGFCEVDVAWMYAGHAIFTATREVEA